MKNFITLLPPPNITGSLHIGHYFNWSLQDFLIRYKKKHGFNTEWILGLDHSGISTQYIVEKQLEEKGLTRVELGREKFTNIIYEWKIEAESLIQKQVDNFQFDMNWDIRHFTMDDNHQLRVKEAFIKFYNDGLISKKLKITNWDTKFNTAISDLEVVEKTEKGKIYIIEYKSNENESIKVATTRPETIFADVALCLHPDDERYNQLQNKKFLIPLLNKEIPIIFDTLCQKDKGEGVLKVTPAHDQTDAEIGEKHNLESINIINKEGKLYNTIQELDGLSVLEARKKILLLFDQNQINYEEQEWEGIKKYTEKSNVPCETILTEQWFLDVSSMAKEALEASKDVQFYPEYLRNTFKIWMDNIKPWCISRQIWWGHQIPVWYTESGKIICAINEEEAQKQAPNEKLTQETDVLDTWFSSALWANLTNNQIDVLITGKDIIFFWVARMIMFSLYLYKKNPFKSLYFNGIVRDKNNQKMSKTKGNVINPIEINQKYGQDCLRFTLLKNAGSNKDIKLNEKEVELSRNFITKINNAHVFLTKFLNTNYQPSQNLDNWIKNKIIEYKEEIEKNIETYEFQKASELFYDLVWNNFCSWYIEGLKTYPSANAINYFYEILSIGEPFLPQTIKNILPEDYQNIVLKKETETFSKTIKITQFLRKIKQLTSMKECYLTYEPQLINNYTKLKIEQTTDNSITLENETIFIDSKYILEFKLHIQKEIQQITAEIESINQKITINKKAPDSIKEEWQFNIQKNTEKLSELENIYKLI